MSNGPKAGCFIFLCVCFYLYISKNLIMNQPIKLNYSILNITSCFCIPILFPCVFRVCNLTAKINKYKKRDIYLLYSSFFYVMRFSKNNNILNLISLFKFRNSFIYLNLI
jgi:hypothetical protein